MPNLSFDVFFDKDFINISASRGRNAPKAKPEWKVRTAPKLPPKEEQPDSRGAPKPPRRATINSTRAPQKLSTAVDKGKSDSPKSSTSDTASQTSEVRRKPPKLGPRKTRRASQSSPTDTSKT